MRSGRSQKKFNKGEQHHGKIGQNTCDVLCVDWCSAGWAVAFCTFLSD